MEVPFKLPTQRHHGDASRQDARHQLDRLYREIGISAVASALHINTLPSPEDREAAALARYDLPACLLEWDAA